MSDSFPRQHARTQRFSLGSPRSFQISPDGSRVAFLRSQGGTDPVTCLWALDLATGREHLVADPAVTGNGGARMTAPERAIRERTREWAGGIVGYATDTTMSVAAFALVGQVYLADLTMGGRVGSAHMGGTEDSDAQRGSARETDAPDTGTPDSGTPDSGTPGRQLGGWARAVPTQVPAFDPRPDPAGRRVAYVCDGALRVTELGTGKDTEIIGPDGKPGLTFGLAEFIAAEEMGRTRGYWWAPDGRSLLVAQVDDTPVNRWYIADPAHPGRPPGQVAYPAAGTPNAVVSLLLVGLDGGQVPVAWDNALFPYLVTVNWDGASPLIVVQSRDQRRLRLLEADPVTAALTVLREDTDPHWLDIVPGVPARTSDGRIVWTADADDARRLLVAQPADLRAGRANPVTPPGLQVRSVLDVDGDVVLFTASQDEPAQISVWRYGPDGLAELTPEPGVHTGRRKGGTSVIVSQSLSEPGATARVLGNVSTGAAHIGSLAERPSLPTPRPDMFAAGERGIRTALLLPSWHQPGSGKLPVLLDPYGGPHAQRVLAAQAAFWVSQWFAEQGFAVVVADGRGTPGRGPAWDRAVAGDLAGPVLDDQVAALNAAADRRGDLDLGRVAIRGWSFGGYLAALAVLRRPDVFHAAVAGAPVTDQRFYDTHYSERYLGDPRDNPAAYDKCSPVKDVESRRGELVPRPLMLIHGLADDNVVVAHTLRLSSALLAAGYPHTVLPLSGVTHMTPQEEVAENLLLLQADFLRRALGV